MGKKNHNEERSICERGLRRGDERSLAAFNILSWFSNPEGTSLIAAAAHSVLDPTSPVQEDGSEMLRRARRFATESGIEVHAPVQDALLIGGPPDDIEDVVAATAGAMAQACDLVLDGFRLRTDTTIVKSPARYSDKRGAAMWGRVMRLLKEVEATGG
jgi:hypothetical protein